MEQALDRRLEIRIDKKMDEALALAAEENGMSKSDYAREALRRKLAVESFDRIRAMVQPYAEKLGLYTDEDVFRVLEEK